MSKHKFLFSFCTQIEMEWELKWKWEMFLVLKNHLDSRSHFLFPLPVPRSQSFKTLGSYVERNCRTFNFPQPNIFKFGMGNVHKFVIRSPSILCPKSKAKFLPPSYFPSPFSSYFLINCTFSLIQKLDEFFLYFSVSSSSEIL